ncbi:GIP [Symbiodinium natans]|uniref:GIP protein n=1 Tax=Symbiodinium natans TaxID=878477 RepID=A0A812T770_9DINO|nr:GIP [Symbiodinium natans]
MAHRTRMQEQDPTWCTFAALALLGSHTQPNTPYLRYFVATVLAATLGDMNYWYHMQPYYDIENINLPDVKGRGKQGELVGGQQLMDAGRVYFEDGATLDLGKSMSFKNLERYKNTKARAGLRLMRDDQRQFFRLAVQQAEAAYNIKANHPLFFYWMQDPVAETMSYKASGLSHALMAVFGHFVLNLLLVAGAALAFSKISHKF